MAPLTGPCGPLKVAPMRVTMTSSKTNPGMFSGRNTSPTRGSPGMIIAGGAPALPTRQVPSVLTMTPSS